MGRTLRYLFAMLWGAVPALALFFLLRPLRLRRLNRKNLSSPFRREAALALFWMYCGGAAMLGLTPRWVVPTLAGLPAGGGWNVAGLPFFSPGSVSLVPFQTFSYSAYILIANVVLFMPFGLFAALLWRGFGWRRALLTGGCITLFIESCQLFVGRAFDIDDLMLNTLGVYCGFLLTLAVRRAFPWFAAGLVVRTAPQKGGGAVFGQTVCLGVRITRIWDLDWYPGFAECVMTDALGVEHRFQDKIPVFSSRSLTPEDIPCAGMLRCVIAGENPDSTLTVNTEFPDDVESAAGERLFRVRPSQLADEEAFS